jgi:hypothetical protein
MKNWKHFGHSIYGGIQYDTMCSFRKGVGKNPENPKPESPGSPLFCHNYHTGHNGLIGMEFNSLMVEEDSNCKKRWCQKNDKLKMTVFRNIQVQRKWIDSVLDGIKVLRASKHLLQMRVGSDKRTNFVMNKINSVKTSADESLAKVRCKKWSKPLGKTLGVTGKIVIVIGKAVPSSLKTGSEKIVY